MFTAYVGVETKMYKTDPLVLSPLTKVLEVFKLDLNTTINSNLETWVSFICFCFCSCTQHILNTFLMFHVGLYLSSVCVCGRV